MRFFWTLSIAIVACEPRAQPVKSAEPTKSRAAERAARGALRDVNSTGLRAAALMRSISKSRLSIVTPGFAEAITVPAPLLYEVQVEGTDGDAAAAGIEVGLDAQRPRRLAPSKTRLTLGELLPVDAELSPGEHWLFAARVAASGIVPRAESGAPLAIARRFFVGPATRAAGAGEAHGWLRRPDGTYNGPSGASVLFDALLFADGGVPLDSPLRVALSGPNLHGELNLRTPFALMDMPSGDYEVQLSAPATSRLSVRFTVNRELARLP